LYFGRFSCVHISGLCANHIAVPENTNDSTDSRSSETDTKEGFSPTLFHVDWCRVTPLLI
jgi:hypothetical protein